MTVDLKAARARVKSLAERFRRGEVIGGTFYATETADYLDDILTALDQAAEALKPLVKVLRDHEDSPDPKRFKHRLTDSYRVAVTLGDLRRAATVYATLKPADTKEGEG